MNMAEITANVSNLPETTDLPLTLTRRSIRASDFLRHPFKRAEQPPLAMIEAAVEAGRNITNQGETR